CDAWTKGICLLHRLLHGNADCIRIVLVGRVRVRSNFPITFTDTIRLAWASISPPFCDFSESGRFRSRAFRTWGNPWYRRLRAYKSSPAEFFRAVPLWGEPESRRLGRIFFDP